MDDFIPPGFTGVLTFGNQKIRCTDFSVNPDQQPLFYKHIIGLRDSIPVNNSAKEDIGTINTQRGLWRPSVKLARASFSYPVTDITGIPVFNAAKTGDDIDAIFTFDCFPLTYAISECKMASFGLRVTAGDILTVSSEIVGRVLSDSGTYDDYRTEEKLITWDECRIQINNFDAPILSFELSITNEVMPIYTSGQNNIDLFPLKLRIGIQEVSGSISFYTKGSQGKNLEWLTAQTTPVMISFDGGGLSIDINAVFNPVSRVGSVTPVISTITFTGIGKALGPRE